MKNSKLMFCCKLLAFQLIIYKFKFIFLHFLIWVKWELVPIRDVCLIFKKLGTQIFFTRFTNKL